MNSTTDNKTVANKRVHGGAFEGPSALLSTQTLRDTGKTNVMGTEANAMQGPMTVTMPVSMPETMDNTVMNINMPTTLNHSASFQDFGFGVGNNMGGSFGNGSFTNPSFDSSGYAGDIDSNFFGSFEPNMTSGIAGEVGAGNLMNGNGFDLDISGDDNSFVDYNAYQGGYMHQPANFLGNNGLTGASTFEGGSVFSSGAGHARASTINDASGSAFENSKEAMLNKQFQTSININPKAKGRNVPVCYGEDAIEVREETMRGRSARAASHKASEGVAAFIKREKEHAKEDGERTSEEDSAESMFTGDGDEDFA